MVYGSFRLLCVWIVCSNVLLEPSGGIYWAWWRIITVSSGWNQVTYCNTCLPLLFPATPSTHTHSLTHSHTHTHSHRLDVPFPLVALTLRSWPGSCTWGLGNHAELLLLFFSLSSFLLQKNPALLISQVFRNVTLRSHFQFVQMLLWCLSGFLSPEVTTIVLRVRALQVKTCVSPKLMLYF